MNQELFKKHHCNQSSHAVIKVATMKNMDHFQYAKEAITCYHQLLLFIVHKVNGTQRRTLVSP